MSLWSERYSAVVKAKRQGLLKPVGKTPCEKCGAPSQAKHHDDYSRPLEVTYLCQRCHVARHKELGWANSTPRSVHTPGPWKILEVMGEKFVAAKPYEGHPYFNRTTTIEIMSDEDYPTKEADIQLIAAAPELLEACKAIVRLGEGFGQMTHVIAHAFAAIRKSEGAPSVESGSKSDNASGNTK